MRPWLLLLWTLGAPAAAADGTPSLAGSGAFTLPDTSTLAPGRFTLGLALDTATATRSAWPLRLRGDVVRGRDAADGDLRTVVVSRVASLPELPVLPPPPLDVIVLPRGCAAAPLLRPLPRGSLREQAGQRAVRGIRARERVLGLKPAARARRAARGPR